MTIFASREGDSRNVKVSFTYGSVTASIVEDAGYLENFYRELGRTLDSIKAEG